MKQEKETAWKNLRISIILVAVFIRYWWFVNLEKLFRYHYSYLFTCSLVVEKIQNNFRSHRMVEKFL